MTESKVKVHYCPMTAADHAAVIRLANEVHGDNYLNDESLADYAAKGTVGDVNLNWLAWLGDELIGIRLTFAPGTWRLMTNVRLRHGRYQPNIYVTSNVRQ